MLADTLSRVVQPSPQDKECLLDVDMHAVGVLATLGSETTQDRLGTKTEKDPELQHVLYCKLNRTPLQGNLRSLDPELTMASGILKVTHVVIPQSLRQVILVRVLQRHLSRSKCEERVRQLMF